MQFTLKLLTIICVSLFVVRQIEGTYEVPEVTIEALKPQGLRVSLPAEPLSGIKFIEFHGSINKEIDINDKEAGDIFIRVTSTYQGKWQFTDKSVALKKDDVLNYWVLAWKGEHETYKKHGLTYKVEDLVSE